MLGLIANNFVRVYHPCAERQPTAPARLPTSTHRGRDAGDQPLVHRRQLQLRQPRPRDARRSQGAIAQKFRGPVGTFGNGSTGYVKNYVYDDRLRYQEPPNFIDPVQASWVIGRERDDPGLMINLPASTRTRRAGRPRDRGRQRRRGRGPHQRPLASWRATAIAPLAPEVFHDGEVADPAALAEVLRALFAEHKLSRRVRLGIANQWVVVRTLRLPVIDDPNELDAAVRFQAQEQIPMPLDQAVLDHRVVGGVPAQEGVAAADRRRRRRRPPRHDRRPARAAAQRRPRAGRRRPLRLRPDPGARELRAAAPAPAVDDDGEPDPAAPRRSSTATSATSPTSPSPSGRSCLFTRVSPVGLENFAAGARRRDRADPGARPHVARPRRPRPARRGDRGRPGPGRPGPRRARSAAPPRCSTSCGSRSTSTAPRRAPCRSSASSSAARAAPSPGSSSTCSPMLGLPFAIGRPDALAGLDDGLRRPPDPLLRPRPGALSHAPRQPDPRRGAPRRAPPTCAAARSPTSSSAPCWPPWPASPCWSLTDNQISERKAEVTQLEAARTRPPRPRRSASPPTPSSTRRASSGSPPSPASPTAASTGSG